MKRLYAWLLALEIDLRLKLRESPHWPRPGGWVVMCEHEDGDWHAMSSGSRFGMNAATGRFPSRQEAREFAVYRNRSAAEFGVAERYYVAHEDLLQRPLPPTY